MEAAVCWDHLMLSDYFSLAGCCFWASLFSKKTELLNFRWCPWQMMTCSGDGWAGGGMHAQNFWKMHTLHFFWGCAELCPLLHFSFHSHALHFSLFISTWQPHLEASRHLSGVSSCCFSGSRWLPHPASPVPMLSQIFPQYMSLRHVMNDRSMNQASPVTWSPRCF